MTVPKQEVVFVDPETPKICATCQFIAQFGDGEFVCLKHSSVRNPYVMTIHPFNNAAQCQFWRKKCFQELTNILSSRDLANLSRGS